jgi:hypothetical protein
MNPASIDKDATRHLLDATVNPGKSGKLLLRISRSNRASMWFAACVGQLAPHARGASNPATPPAISQYGPVCLQSWFVAHSVEAPRLLAEASVEPVAPMAEHPPRHEAAESPVINEGNHLL